MTTEQREPRVILHRSAAFNEGEASAPWHVGNEDDPATVYLWLRKIGDDEPYVVLGVNALWGGIPNEDAYWTIDPCWRGDSLRAFLQRTDMHRLFGDWINAVEAERDKIGEAIGEEIQQAEYDEANLVQVYSIGDWLDGDLSSWAEGETAADFIAHCRELAATQDIMIDDHADKDLFYLVESVWERDGELHDEQKKLLNK